MKKIILILALIFSCGLTAQTKIYEIQNKGKGVISELTPANLLLIKDDSAKIAISNVTGLGDALDLKANLASPALIGTPTAPTPTTTTGIANKSYVDGLDNGNVKLTGQQAIAGVKTFTNDIVLNGGVLTFLGTSSLQTGNPSIYRIGNRLALNVAPGGKNVILDGNAISSSITLNLQNSSGTLALTSNPTSLTATSFIKPSAPTTNILLAGGGDIAQNTAFNKPFGITTGTVVEGGTLGTNAYTSTAYLPTNGNSLTTSRLRNFGDQINANALTGGGAMWNYGQNGAPSNTPSGFTWGSVFQFNSQDTDDLALQFANNISHNVTTPTRDLYFRSKNNLAWQDDWKKLWHDGNFNPANYLPLSGGTLSGALNGTSATFSSTVTATSYTATSLPVFENNAAASSLAVGQFYRTSTGVLMVKF